MTRFMLDALDIDNFPSPIPVTTLLASYVDHPEYDVQPFTLLQQRYPNHRLVSIAAHGGDAQVCDVESGAMTPTDVPGWVSRQRMLVRSQPWCYATKTNWLRVLTQCFITVTRPPLWWKADWSDGPEIPVGAIGTQYAANGKWDTSVLLDYIPGFDPLSANPLGDGTIITNSTTTEEDDMLPYLTTVTNPGGSPATFVIDPYFRSKTRIGDPTTAANLAALADVNTPGGRLLILTEGFTWDGLSTVPDAK